MGVFVPSMLVHVLLVPVVVRVLAHQLGDETGKCSSGDVSTCGAVLLQHTSLQARVEGNSEGLSEDMSTGVACDEASWPDKDHDLVCGACKVLVDRFNSFYGTCDSYCASVSRPCVAAWEEQDDDCNIKYELACDQAIDSSDAICQCGDMPDVSEDMSSGLGDGVSTGVACEEASWPDKDHGLVCGECKVLVDRFSSYGSCSNYCAKVGRSCVAAWEEQDDDCNVKFEMTCDQTIDSSDAICQCGDVADEIDDMSTGVIDDMSTGVSDDMSVGVGDDVSASVACEEASWPDKDHGLVCGECKVLVDRFSSFYGTCSSYCARVGRSCVAAWEEQNDDCNVKHEMTCDQALASSDAICQCGGEVPPSPVLEGPQGRSLKVMSYNTEYKGYQDGRVGNFAAKIRDVAPAIVGLQECQDRDALAGQSGYTPVRDTGNQNYILFDPSKLSLMGGDMMSIPTDGYAPRAITWGQFRLGDVSVYVFNTHLPHNRADASSQTTHARIAADLLQKRRDLGIEGEPTIVVGDMNSHASNFNQVQGGGFESNLVANGFVWAYTAKGNPGYGRIDQILYSGAHWTHTGCGDTGTGGSDHTSIACELTLK